MILNETEEQTSQILAEIRKLQLKDTIVKITYKLPKTSTDLVDVKKIQLACSHTMHLVAIVPIREMPTRTHRNFLSTEMDLQTLLKVYFESKDTLKNRSQELIDKTLQLQNEMDEEQEL